MSGMLCFLIGLLIGGLIGVVVMCLLQINTLYRKEEEQK